MTPEKKFAVKPVEDLIDTVLKKQVKAPKICGRMIYPFSGYPISFIVAM